MVRTDAQKKAVAASKKALDRARKTLGGEAGAITRRIAGGGVDIIGWSQPTVEGRGKMATGGTTSGRARPSTSKESTPREFITKAERDKAFEDLRSGEKTKAETLRRISTNGRMKTEVRSLGMSIRDKSPFGESEFGKLLNRQPKTFNELVDRGGSKGKIKKPELTWFDNLRKQSDQSTQKLIDAGVPSMLANLGGSVSNLGLLGAETLSNVNKDWSDKLKAYREARKGEGALNQLDIKPIGYSRWSQERKDNWDKAIKKQAEQQEKESKTYVPSTIRAGSDRLINETIENPLYTGALLAGAGALSVPTTIAGVTSIISGADIAVSDFGKAVGEQAERTKETQPIRGAIADVTGGALEGIGWVMPKTSGELLLDAGAVKFLPGLIKRHPGKSGLGLAGFGGYNIYSGATDKDIAKEEKFGKYLMGGGSFLGAVPGATIGFRKLAARGSDDFFKPGVTDFGITKTDLDVTGRAVEQAREFTPEEFKALEVIGDTGKIDVEFIPGRGETIKTDLDTLKLLSGDINLKDKIKLPKTRKIQRDILDVVKTEKGIVSGSFAQESMVKGSRPFKDLDILTAKPKKLVSALRSGLGDRIKIKKQDITDSPLGKFQIFKVFETKTGQHLADIDPIRFSEEGFAKMFEPIKFGEKILSPEDFAKDLVKKKKLKLTEPSTIKELKKEGFIDFDTGKSAGFSGLFYHKEKGMKVPEIVIPSKKQYKKLFPDFEQGDTLAHELIHYRQFEEKTPGKIFTFLDDRLPYALKPSELQAFALSERRLAKGFKIEGLRLLPPEVRLLSKTIQSTRPLPTGKRKKVAKDIAQLLGRKDLETSPSLLRGYGFSKAEQKAIFGDSDIFATHGGQSIIPAFGKKITIKGKPGDVFFSTPSKADSKTAFARKTRMGFGGDVEGISLVELFRPKNIKNIELIPPRKDVIIERGKFGDFVQPNLRTSEIEVGRKIGKKGSFDLEVLKKYKTIVDNEAVNIAIVRKALDVEGGNKRIADIFRGKTIDISKRPTKKPKIITPTIRPPKTTGIKSISDRVKNDNRLLNEILRAQDSKAKDIFSTTSTKRDLDITPLRLPTTPRPPELTPLRLPPRIPTPRPPTPRPPTPRPPTPRPPSPKPPTPRPPERKRNKKIRDGVKRLMKPIRIPKGPGYLPMFKESQTSKKFKSFTKPIKNPNVARNFSRHMVDNSIAATYKLKIVKNPKSFSKRSAPMTDPRKFRNYKVVKGKAVRLKSMAEIERKERRLDTRGEVKQIQIAKLMKQKFGGNSNLKVPKLNLR